MRADDEDDDIGDGDGDGYVVDVAGFDDDDGDDAHPMFSVVVFIFILKQLKMCLSKRMSLPAGKLSGSGCSDDAGATANKGPQTFV